VGGCQKRYFPEEEEKQEAEKGRLGRAVQVDPIKPTLKAPGTKRVETKM
jgi:hypothetical protein